MTVDFTVLNVTHKINIKSYANWTHYITFEYSILNLKTIFHYSLGMHHDGNTNNCPKEGFIMSPSRGITGELLWSECSARVAANLK